RSSLGGASGSTVASSAARRAPSRSTRESTSSRSASIVRPLRGACASSRIGRCRSDSSSTELVLLELLELVEHGVRIPRQEETAADRDEARTEEAPVPRGLAEVHGAIRAILRAVALPI